MSESTNGNPSAPPNGGKWKVLIADDEKDVHEITRIVLHDFSYMGKPLDIISAFSAKESRQVIEHHPDIALILLDAVMETDDAGLQLVDYIRREKGLLMVRIVLRTGQAGHAPERYVIDNYDIDDYKNKSELTSQKLYTTVRSALKNFRDIQAVEANRLGLKNIIECSPLLFGLQSHEEILKDILSIQFELVEGRERRYPPIKPQKNGFILLLEKTGEVRIALGTGQFENVGGDCVNMLDAETKRAFEQVKETGNNYFGGEFIFLGFAIRGEVIGLSFLKNEQTLSEDQKRLLEIFAHQAVAAIQTHTLYDQLLQSEKMAAVGQITGGILHDVKNAVAGVNFSAQLLQNPDVSMEEKTKICGIAARKFAWVQEMIEDIFNFSRGGGGLKLKNVGVGPLLKPVLEYLQSDSTVSGISVNTDITFQGRVRADSVKIQRGLLNLCKNAVEAMANIRKEKTSELALSVKEKKGRAVFSVSDNGCGIEEKYLSRICQPFFTLDKKGGTGLGLSVVKQIIEGHEGKLDIVSRPGEGATFTFDLEIVE